MNLVSVDIPSKKGKTETGGPWGQLVLYRRANEVKGSLWLRVLVYIDLDAIGPRRVFVGTIERCLQEHLLDFKWLVIGQIAAGAGRTNRKITNVRPALASLAAKLGKSFDKMQ